MDNEKLARWQGYKPHPNGVSCYLGEPRMIGGTLKCPDYLNDDAAAMGLLDTLVERHYGIELKKHRVHELWSFEIIRDDLLTVESNYIVAACRDTRREAVVAAVLELIGKEAKDGF